MEVCQNKKHSHTEIWFKKKKKYNKIKTILKQQFIFQYFLFMLTCIE